MSRVETVARPGMSQVRVVNLSDAPEMRELRQIIARRVRAAVDAGTCEDPVPIADYERIVGASIAEYNALMMARNAMTSTSRQ